MGLYKYLKKAWQKPSPEALAKLKQDMVVWRTEPVTLRLEHPTRLDRAHSLGFKAKQGYFIVRQRVTRGGKQSPKPAGGRRSKKNTRQHVVHVNYQTIAEQRANKSYPNCEVLNSYYLAKDGRHYWYEIILVERDHPVILADPKINWISKQKGRVFRGITSSARKSRGLRRKGIGAEKVRPSLRSNRGLLH